MKCKSYCPVQRGLPGLPGLPGSSGFPGSRGAPGAAGTNFSPVFVNSFIPGTQGGTALGNFGIIPFSQPNPIAGSASFATFDAPNNGWILQPGNYRLTCSFQIYVSNLVPILPNSYINAVDITAGLPGVEIGLATNVTSVVQTNPLVPGLLFFDSNIQLASAGGPRNIVIQYRTPNGNFISIMNETGPTDDRGSWMIQPIAT